MNPNTMFGTDKDFQYSEFQETEKEYRIQPFDRLDIRIYTNKGYKLIDIEGTPMGRVDNVLTYGVEYDGFVKVPSIGRIRVADMTVREAEYMLENLYDTLYVEPFVMIRVLNRRVFVFSGGSSDASVIELNNDNCTLIEALAQAGGISDLSKAYRIKLLRGNLNNPEVYMFNISTVKGMSKANFMLEANDIIYVETRPKYASRFMTEISPYLSILTTGLLLYNIFGR
ncbi:MAG: polysaccharide biosynthesis/export family protein [Bacteroidota bacterium]